MTTYLLTTGDDTITGTAGADTFDGFINGREGGLDILDGGAGNDTFVVYQSDKGSSISGGAGTDILRLYEQTVNFAIYRDFEILDITFFFAPEYYGLTSYLAKIVEEFDTVIDSSRPGGWLTVEVYGDGNSVDLSNTIGDGYSLNLTGIFSKAGFDIIASKGDDIIIGSAFNDILDGSDGNDTIHVGGSDVVKGGDGNDTFIGGLSSQTSGKIDGGEGVDTLKLQGSLGSANIFNVEILDTKGLGDFSVSIRALSVFDTINIYNNDTEINLIGTGGVVDFLDYVKGTGSPVVSGAALTSGYTAFGTAKNDSFVGSSFNDTFYGSVGADKIFGGEGLDTVDYSKSTSAVTVRLEYTGSEGGSAEGDEFESMEIVIGSAFSDTIEGTYRADRLFGGTGNDVLIGGNWTDHLSGGLGIDTASYLSGTYGVRASLSDPLKNTGDARGDAYASIENLTGTRYEDELSGNNGTNVISGDSGDDVLQGYAGDDKLFGGDWNDTLIGGAGADYLSGGAHFDTASYATAAKAVTASLTDSSINTGDAAGDIYNSIELLDGSAFNDRLFGNNGANLIFGDTGNDTLSGDGGNDSLLGSDGDDVLNGGVGADKLDGGSGFDTASYAQAAAGVKVNLADPSLNAGEAKGDTFNSIENLEGSAFNDTLDGNAGANTLTGLGGIDVLRGAAGNDTLLGGDGGDKLGGGDANDILSGGAGADYLSGGTGTDTASYADAKAGVTVSLVAPAGNAGEAAGDTFSSIENLVGSNLDDMLTGNSVANRIDGGQGNDTIRGHNGNDVLAGGDGHDKLNGGTGADSLEGGSGTDTASYADASDGIIASLANASINTGEAEGDAYSSIENLTGSAHDDVLNGDNNANAIIGDAGNDAVKGYAGDDKLFGGDGNDTLNGGAGADYLSGGAGSDAASYAQATSTVKVNLADPSLNAGEASGDTFNSIENLEGSNFDDTLDGNSATNSLSGSTGNDILRGAAGNDTLQGGTGDDTLGGGDGNDILLGGAGADYLSGGLGIDNASYADATSGVRVNLADSSLNTGTARNDTYNSIENLLGSAMNDSLEGNATNNRIDGGDGDDLLNGGSGSDRLVGGNGIDTATYITAAAGLTVSLANSSVNTGEAAGDVYQSIEKLTGSKFDDLLTGDDNASGNRVYGANGDDVIDGGGGGSDRLEGGSGDDFFIARAGDEYFDGGTGRDTLSFEEGTSGIFIDNYRNGGFANGDDYTAIEVIIATDFNDTVYFGSNRTISSNVSAYAGKGDDVLIGDDHGISLYGEDGNDTLVGGAGGDSLFGGADMDTASYATATAGVLASLANNSINKGDALGDVYSSIENLVGSDFDDRLYGNNAKNTIVGGGGQDAFKGYNGDDVLIGEAGDDILNGGLGIDELDGGNGLDSASYADATAGVYAALHSPSLNKGDAADDIYISIEGLIGSEYNDTLTGDSATNKIEGMSGNDVLIGEAGNDILNGGAGVDKLDGGIGLDSASYADASAGVYAALYSPSLNQGEAADDIYVSIEGLIGTRYNDTLIGNPAANKIEGMNGNDLIDGGSGSDVLTGGDGSDAFVFDTKLSASNNVDVITDYEVGIDAIALDKAIFTALSGLEFMSSDQFSWNDDGSATDSSDRIAYDSDTGYLFYDADGSGAGASIHFATVSSNFRLTNADFYIYE